MCVCVNLALLLLFVFEAESFCAISFDAFIVWASVTFRMDFCSKDFWVKIVYTYLCS